jgi:CheY-like chemotaxis protein
MSKSKQRPIKIVLAEDEYFIAMAYEEGLSYAGYQVVLANDGEEALAALKQDLPDLVLLDIIMPNMNGFEALTIIRADPKLKHLPVVVLSNLSQAADEAEARRLGATDFLIKSDYSLKELVAFIEDVLASSAQV